MDTMRATSALIIFRRVGTVGILASLLATLALGIGLAGRATAGMINAEQGALTPPCSCQGESIHVRKLVVLFVFSPAGGYVCDRLIYTHREI